MRGATFGTSQGRAPLSFSGNMTDSKPGPTQITLEAELKPLQGKEWDVTIAGPSGRAKLVTINGRRFIASPNEKLYSVDALKSSVALWDGVHVYDNHQTHEQFVASMGGMRSVKDEWVGVITDPYWDEPSQSLKGKLKLIDSLLSQKLKAAWEADVLKTIGLSMNTYPNYTGDMDFEGKRYRVAEGFNEIMSVDIVGRPAAGGGFNRLLASVQMEKSDMDEEIKEKGYITKDELPGLISAAVNEALKERAADVEDEIDVDELDDEEAVEAVQNFHQKKLDRKVTEAQKQLTKLQRAAESEQQKAKLARSELMVEQKLAKAHLPEKFEAAVREQFEGRIVEGDAVDRAIEAQRNAYASLDPTGRVKTGIVGSDIRIGIDPAERVEMALMRLLMGDSEFRSLENSSDRSVQDRLKESEAYTAWKNNQRPSLPRYDRVSNVLWEWFGGNPILDPRAMEAATTSSLATVVKNTVNIMAANRYSMRELWFERIARVEEVDTIDDATLARTFGVNTLSTVPEGAAYTELNLADEEETASFVKRGNYIGVTLETLMKDKINEIRTIPQKLADAWYNTQSDLVANVFTVNSATGPVLSDSGALFNATALSSVGGHDNLLTTALSHAAFSAARLEMRKKTDQPLGAGRKLLINPRYLLVPVDLETTAWEIRNSELFPGADMDSAGQGAQTRNFYNATNMFEVIVVPSWTDPTDWALVADPMQYPAIWLIYPRGQRTPQIFTADGETSGTMFTNDEIRFKARLMTYRFSATYDSAPVSDFRGLHKSNVAG